MSPGIPNAWRTLKRGNMEWLMDPEACGDWIDDNGEIPISRWLTQGIAKTVKTGPHRSVYRLTLATGSFFLKHYRTPDWQAVLQNVVRPCKAELEWQAARQVAKLGLKTFETVALGKRRAYGFVMDNFLITREIPDVIALDEFVLQTFSKLDLVQQRLARKGIARQLGQITASLHQARLLHRDFHPGNLLIQTTGHDFSLYLIDLHALSWKRRIARKTSAYNISLLNNFFARLSSRADRMRFLDAYSKAQSRGQVKEASRNREALRYIEHICQSELSKADIRGDKKWQRGNRRLIILENTPNRCRGLTELGLDALRSFQTSPENLFAEPNVMAWQTRTAFRRCAVVEIEMNGRMRRAIAIAFRQPGLARNAWEMGHALTRRRMHTPRPLFFIETQSGEWDYLVLEDVPNALPLSEVLKKRFRSLPAAEWESWLNNVSTALAVELRKLHEHGFHQPNLRLDSLRIRDEDGQTLCFDAVETIRHVRTVSFPDVISSLATAWLSLPDEVHISPTQALRFLRSFLGPQFSKEWKSCWRGIAIFVRRQLSKEAA